MSDSKPAIDPAIQNILFATDFSEPSHAAAPVAHAHARRWGATLHLLYVCPDDDRSPHPELDGLAREVGADVSVKTACENGRPADQILAYAEKNSIDLIVLGTHGRTGVSRVLLGSVAERVTRMAACPVLTVPRIAARFQAAAQAPAALQPEPELEHCVVCGTKGEELICRACREKIRGEAIVKTR